MTNQEARLAAEAQAKSDYLAVLGQVVTVKTLSAYNAKDDSVDLDGVEIKVRVLSTDDDDLCHWVDEYLDPYWNVEPLNVEDIPDIAGLGLRSFWTFGKSYRVLPGTCEVVPADNNQSVPHV